ncbi:copper homeostasis protein CutC [Echinicola sp. CAU 1574]|uniref:PF03932 family protein CutC n=1 Tax=Echinicola arenosa TaxID=2774144 RepID=A0ABR9ANR0_9BACT|nr:copper homeostasis protein CutC [Echinicola arenosa]MBD8489992.1 copper homeostasis protein CutC [Echinicola arenosa]
MSSIILEAPVFTVEAAIKASEYGINRLELCSDFLEGGETPTVGTLKYLKSKVKVPIFVMIRPRGGDFVYTNDELQVMKEDISILKEHGANGFVFGVLTPKGEVNIGACEQLIEVAEGLPCTFHRAFDASRNLEKSLEAVIECGFRRILTSGGKNTVTEGKEMIKKLLDKAGNRIIIMPGGGMKPELVEELSKSGNLKEIHASCKVWKNSASEYWNSNLELSAVPENQDKVLSVSKEEVEKFLQVTGK